MPTNEKQKAFFDRYYKQTVSYGANEVDAVIGYFLKRGFGEVSAVNTASVILQQAAKDKLPAYELLDTLKGITDVQLSNVVAQILNLDRSNCSTIGYRIAAGKELFDQRNIIV